MNNKKGKKINHEFVNEFISKSISDGISSSEDIISEAKKKILEIDKKLANINVLKEKRSNLLDVVLSFEVKKEDRSNQKLDLAIMSLPKNDVIKFLIKNLDNKGIDYSELKRKFYVKDIQESLALLTKIGVVSKEDTVIVPAEFFERCYNVFDSN